jgi:hypothetical protein
MRVDLFFISVFAGNRQFMTSFLSAAGQYFTAIRCFHTLAETMNGFPAALMRLIGSFFTWHCIKFFPAYRQAGFYKYYLDPLLLHPAGHHPLLFVKGRQR